MSTQFVTIATRNLKFIPLITLLQSHESLTPTVAMTTQYDVIPFLQWYETHTMLRNGMKCIPVLILKS